jgi:hypothetical protein
MRSFPVHVPAILRQAQFFLFFGRPAAHLSILSQLARGLKPSSRVSSTRHGQQVTCVRSEGPTSTIESKR